jgi:cytochrome c-type protein NapB
MNVFLQKLPCVIYALLLLSPIGTLSAASISDTQLGLSKTAVNESPAPSKFNYSENFPGVDPLLPRAYPGAPPQVPHNIEAFLPVSKDRNMCKTCHDKPETIGKKVKGQPTAIPASHYTDHRVDDAKMGKTLIGARTVCTQCHVPQANVRPLVENTFDD